MKNLSFNLSDDSYVFVWQSLIWVKQNIQQDKQVDKNKFTFVEALS